jgi:hypothetical protein
MGLVRCTVHGERQTVLLSPRIEEAFRLRSFCSDIAMIPMRWRLGSINGQRTDVVTWWVDPELASTYRLPMTEILSEEETDRLFETPLIPVCVACFLAWQGNTEAQR